MVKSVKPQENEVERYAAAWRDRRRRFLAYVIELNSLWILLLLPLFFRNLQKSDKYILVLPAWFVGNMIVGIWVNRFRCPRCGELYYFTWKFQRTGRWRDCRHCGLAQDTVPS